MTREEAKQFLPIIQGYADGKTIQSLKSDDTWRDITWLNFTNPANYYRIKPEPKYRPFKTKEECWEEMQKHQPFGWLKSKNNESYICIGNVSWEGAFKRLMITFSTIELMPYSSDSVFDGYTFADGTPFGMTEE